MINSGGTMARTSKTVPDQGGQVSQSETLPQTSSRKKNSSLNIDVASSLKIEDLARIRKQYKVPNTVVLRLPEPNERPDQACSNPAEICVYEGFFKAGMRMGVPRLVSQFASYYQICPSQFSPNSWNFLIAVQALGEIHQFEAGVAQVLLHYYLKKVDGSKLLYFFHLRNNKQVIVSEARLCEPTGWSEKFLFMGVEQDVTFPTVWAPLVKEKLTKLNKHDGGGLIALNDLLSIDLSDRNSVRLTSESNLAGTTIWGAKALELPRGDDLLEETDQEALALVIEGSVLDCDLLGAYKANLAESEALSQVLGEYESANPLESDSFVEDLGSRKRARTESIHPLPHFEFLEGYPQLEPLKGYSGTNSTSALEGDHNQTIRELESRLFLQDFKRLDESGPQAILDDTMTSLLKEMAAVSWAKHRLVTLETLNDQHKKEITSLREQLLQKNEKDRERDQTITELRNQLAQKSRNLEDVESKLASRNKNLQSFLKAKQRTVELRAAITMAYQLHEDVRMDRHHLWDYERVKSAYIGMKKYNSQETEVQENTSSSALGSQNVRG
uniref:Uncharacterized protein n=1 Tax=Noccaea caerulescens TaxID=107243 RepID=A0A1J3H7D7_NOCCA